MTEIARGRGNPGCSLRRREPIQLADAIRIGVGGGSLTRVLGFADRPMDTLGTPTNGSLTRIADFKELRPAFRRRGNGYGLRGWLRSSGLLIASQADFGAFLHAYVWRPREDSNPDNLQIRNLALDPV